MLHRVEEKDVHAMIEDSKPPADGAAASAAMSPTTWNDSGDALAAEPLAPECTIDDFAKVDLRVARVIAAEDVADARKLLKLTLSLGGGIDENRFRRHQRSVQAAGSARPLGDLRGESGAAKNEIRHERSDGVRGGTGRQRSVSSSLSTRARYRDSACIRLCVLDVGHGWIANRRNEEGVEACRFRASSCSSRSFHLNWRELAPIRVPLCFGCNQPPASYNERHFTPSPSGRGPG